MKRLYRPSEVADILDRAAVRIENGRWVSRCPDAKDEYCAMTALCTVAPTRGFEAEYALVAELAHDYNHSGCIPDWNDEQRDKRKVIRALRRTARNIRNRKLVRQGWYEWEFVD